MFDSFQQQEKHYLPPRKEKEGSVYIHESTAFSSPRLLNFRDLLFQCLGIKNFLWFSRNF